MKEVYNKKLNELLLSQYRDDKSLEIRNKIIESNIPLVKNIASMYAKITGLNVEDLCSYGYEGLIYAVTMYDFDSYNTFYNYTYSCISGYINVGIYEIQGIKRGKFESEYLKEKKQAEEIKDISLYDDSELYIFIKNLVEDNIIKSQNMLYRRLNQILVHCASSLENIDDNCFEGENNIENFLDNLNNEQLKEFVSNMFNALTEKEKLVIKLYYGFDCVQKSISLIAKEYNVSYEAIRQIHENALKKFRKSYKAKIAREYLYDIENTYSNKSKTYIDAKKIK